MWEFLDKKEGYLVCQGCHSAFDIYLERKIKLVFSHMEISAEEPEKEEE